MGILCSLCSKPPVDDTPLAQSKDVPGHILRKPVEDEIEQIIQSIAVETFQKERKSILQRLDDTEISHSDVMRILRVLNSDSEKFDFIKLCHKNIISPDAIQISSEFHNPSKKKQVMDLLNPITLYP